MWSHFPDCTNEEIRNALDKSAQDLGSSGKDNTFGFGLVQTLKALDYIDANPCKVHTTCPEKPDPPLPEPEPEPILNSCLKLSTDPMPKEKAKKKDLKKPANNQKKQNLKKQAKKQNLLDFIGSKCNAAQMRQTNRDKRRTNPFSPAYNPTRSEPDEHCERLRKHHQGLKKARKDPYDPNTGNQWYARKREVARENRCKGGDLASCGYEALHVDTSGSNAKNHKVRDYDDVHKKDYGPTDYGVGNSWWP